MNGITGRFKCSGNIPGSFVRKVPLISKVSIGTKCSSYEVVKCYFYKFKRKLLTFFMRLNTLIPELTSLLHKEFVTIKNVSQLLNRKRKIVRPNSRFSGTIRNCYDMQFRH
jgi:hypothetical protein